MKILRIIGIIIEVIIAVAIFIILAQKTPLFERILSTTSKTTTSEQTATLTGDAVEKKNTLNNTGISDKTVAFNSDPIPVDVSSSTRGCSTPWGDFLEDNQSITAYTSSRSTTNNICNSELRVCHQGKLSGSYKYKTCSFIVDGRRDGQDIINGASHSDQQIGDGATKFQQYLKDNKQYIQPGETKKSKELTYADTQPRLMENSNITEHDTRPDFLDQEGLPHPHNLDGTGSCMSPRGEKIRHGTFVYAYDIDKSSIQQICKLEKRACINGKLSGTYTKKSCDDNVSQKNQTSDTLQSLAWYENDRLGRQFDPIINNGYLSPGGPKKINLNDLIRDSVKMTPYGVRDTRGNAPTSGTNNHTTTDDQNYIEFSSCVTPWGVPVQHGQHVIAYRNQAVERNSLCDVETRTCRDGKLRGSFQYKSCNPNTKAIKNNSTRYPGKIIIESTETVVDVVEHTSKSVWDWFKDLFK